jgi:Sensors of blue-light using FAD
MNTSWMYVSKSLLVAEHNEAVLHDIVRLSRQRNQPLDITGCLLLARGRFAQVLEGPADSVAELRISIEADSRHTDVTTIDLSSAQTRRFSGWSLAYAGPSIFVEKAMADTIQDVAVAGGKNAIGRLLRMMQGFAGPQPSSRHH